jgi:hypothetical protein
MDESIARAVREHRLLELGYGGYSRVVEPHAYGVDRRGEERVLCFPVSGGSTSGARAGWKLLRLRDAASVTPLRTDFLRRPEFDGHARGMAEVWASA